MRRAILTACVLVLGACAGTDCPDAPVPVDTRGAVTCDQVRQDWGRAQAALARVGLTDARLSEWAWVYEKPEGAAVGVTHTPGKWVELDPGERCVIAHEVFHMYEWDVLGKKNPTHEGWAERGWLQQVEQCQ